MIPTAPCKDCEYRQPACHDRCAAYKRFKEEKKLYNLQLSKIKGENVYFQKKAKENANRNRLKKK